MLNQNKISNSLSAGQGDLKALKLVQSLKISEKSFHPGHRVWQIVLLSLALPLPCQKVNFKTNSGWNISQKKTFFTDKTFLTHFWPKKKTNLLFKNMVGSGCGLNTFKASKPRTAETKSHVSMLLAELVNQHETQFKNEKKTGHNASLILLGGVVKTQNQSLFITSDEIEQALKLQKLGLNIHKTTLKQTRAKLSPFQSVLKRCLTCLNSKNKLKLA